jgi:hypothetical protein
VLVAILTAASIPFGVATALGAFSGINADPEDPYAAGHGPHEGGYNTNRRAVGHGESVLGAYTLYASSGPEGTCAELEFPGRNPPGGGHAFYSDCSSETSSPINAATVTGDEGAVVYGLAPKETDRVEVDRNGYADTDATLHTGEPADDRDFFVDSIADPEADGTIVAVDRGGRQIATRPVP